MVGFVGLHYKEKISLEIEISFNITHWLEIMNLKSIQYTESKENDFRIIWYNLIYIYLDDVFGLWQIRHTSICTMSSSVTYRNRATLNTMQCKMFYQKIETQTERILTLLNKNVSIKFLWFWKINWLLMYIFLHNTVKLFSVFKTSS